jgi:hypothetical protein
MHWVKTSCRLRRPSNGALATVERGWFREAILEKAAAHGKKFYIHSALLGVTKNKLRFYTPMLLAQALVTT